MNNKIKRKLAFTIIDPTIIMLLCGLITFVYLHQVWAIVMFSIFLVLMLSANIWLAKSMYDYYLASERLNKYRRKKRC